MKPEASAMLSIVRAKCSAEDVRRLLDLGPDVWRSDLAGDIMQELRVILEEKTRDVG